MSMKLKNSIKNNIAITKIRYFFFLENKIIFSLDDYKTVAKNLIESIIKTAQVKKIDESCLLLSKLNKFQQDNKLELDWTFGSISENTDYFYGNIFSLICSKNEYSPFKSNIVDIQKINGPERKDWLIDSNLRYCFNPLYRYPSLMIVKNRDELLVAISGFQGNHPYNKFLFIYDPKTNKIINEFNMISSFEFIFR